MSEWFSPKDKLPEAQKEVVVKIVDKNYGKDGDILFPHSLILTGSYHENYGFLVYGFSDWFGPVEVEKWKEI